MTSRNRSHKVQQGMSSAEIERLDEYWRAANYLSVGQIYLLDNPLLREPLSLDHVKPRLLGHWGTTPGLNFIYAHLNRLIRARDLDMIFITGPGHGGPALVANTWLEGSYTERHTDVTRDAAGMAALFGTSLRFLVRKASASAAAPVFALSIPKATIAGS